jgi:hypothetical protein
MAPWRRFHYCRLALSDTRTIAALISIPPPAAFTRVLPALMAATLALVVVIAVLTMAVYAWRTATARALPGGADQTKATPLRRGFCPAAAAVLTVLLYVLTIWLAVMFALSLLWAGGGLIASKATMDGTSTLSVVDETLPRLIQAAMGINPATQVSVQVIVRLPLRIAAACSARTTGCCWGLFKSCLFQSLNFAFFAVTPITTITTTTTSCRPPGCCLFVQGYLVHVDGRDVNIGTSSCSLFCFTLARAMLADNIDCTCNAALAVALLPPGNVTHDIKDAAMCARAPVMCSINAYAYSLFKTHMTPAVGGIVVALLSVAALLALASATAARAFSAGAGLCGGGSGVRCAVLSRRRCGADAQMQLDGTSTAGGSSGSDSPTHKGVV